MMTKTPKQTSCIILAGGKGQRAGGEDKGLITYKNKPLIQHVIDSVAPQTDEIIISANRNLNIYKQYTNQVISDSADDYKGPLAGIASCLHHCKYEQVLVVACDMPCLPENLVERLNEKLLDHSISIAMVNHHHQLALLVKKTLADSIILRVNNNQLKLIQWVESLPYATVDFDDNPNAFLNLNTLGEED